MQRIDIILDKLEKSKFRNSFHLSIKDKKYVSDKGYSVIREHAYDFIKKRLAPAKILNDGHQTPYHGHPVFTAEHATATCCRNCLYKWHKIPRNTNLTDNQINYIVDVIMAWIIKEMK